MTDPTPLPKKPVNPCFVCVKPEECQEAGACLYERANREEWNGYEEADKAPVVPLRPRGN